RIPSWSTSHALRGAPKVPASRRPPNTTGEAGDGQPRPQEQGPDGLIPPGPTGAGAASAIARHDRGDQAPDQNPEKEAESHLDPALALQLLRVTPAACRECH